jgi:hypothetical protein
MANWPRRVIRSATGDDGTGDYWHRFTPDGRQVIRHALAEARELGHPCMADEHVLLGVLRHGGQGAALLEANGLDLATARAELLRVGPTPIRPVRCGLSAWTSRACDGGWRRPSVRKPCSWPNDE